LTERMRYEHLPPPDQTVLQSPALYVELERRERPDMLRERFGSDGPPGPSRPPRWHDARCDIHGLSRCRSAGTDAAMSTDLGYAFTIRDNW
jgi:hypothetical protein